MKKYLLLLLVFIGFIVTAYTSYAETINKPTTPSNAIFIDSRLMVLAHPLFNAYDVNTGRFRGTPSEPFIYDVSERKVFVEKIKELEEKLLKSPENLKKKLKGVPFKDRIAIEREHLIEKRTLEVKLEAMKRRIYFSRQVPINPGMSPYKSIYPECCDIVETCKQIIEELKTKYKTNIVLDIANILPIIKKGMYIVPTRVDNNYLKVAYKENSKINDKQLESFIEKADRFWAEKLELDADIIPYGAVDCRLEAIKLMEEKGKNYKIWDWNKDNQ